MDTFTRKCDKCQDTLHVDYDMYVTDGKHTCSEVCRSAYVSSEDYANLCELGSDESEFEGMVEYTFEGVKMTIDAEHIFDTFYYRHIFFSYPLDNYESRLSYETPHNK